MVVLLIVAVFVVVSIVLLGVVSVPRTRRAHHLMSEKDLFSLALTQARNATIVDNTLFFEFAQYCAVLDMNVDDSGLIKFSYQDHNGFSRMIVTYPGHASMVRLRRRLNVLVQVT